MTELTALGLKVTSEGVSKAASDLDKFIDAAGRAEKASDRMAGKASQADAAIKAGGASAAASAARTKLLGDRAHTTAGSLENMMRSGNGVTGAFQRMSLGTTGTTGALARMSGVLGTVTGRLIAMATAALSVGGYIRLADAWSDMQSKVGAAVKEMSAAPALMSRMVDLANASYSPLNQTVEVYARNVGVLRDLGLSADQAADFTESLNHMLVITATKGEQAASVQNALSKAMAIGKLQADGLETVMAHGGRVAEALAAQLGTNVNGLREMASQGKITSAVMAGAVLSSLAQVRREAGEMPATVADGIVRIQTGLQYLIGVFDQTVGSSGSLAMAIVAVADAMKAAGDWAMANGAIIQTVFDTVIGTAFVLATGLAVKFAVTMGVQVVGSITAAAASAAAYQISLGATTMAQVLLGTATTGTAAAFTLLSRAIILTGFGALIVGAGYLIGKFLDLARATGGWGEAFTLLGEVAAGVWDGIVTAADAVPVGLNAVWETVKEGFYGMLAGLMARWREFLVWLADSLSSTKDLPIMGDAYMSLRSKAIDAGSAVYDFTMKAGQASEAAKALQGQAAGMVSSGFDKAKEALAKLNVTVTTTTGALGGTGTGTGTGTGLSGAAAGAGKATDELRKEVERLNKAAAAGRTPLEKYRAELEKLERLKKAGLTDAAYAMELERINEELAKGIPIIGDMASAWGDFVAGGFKDFKGFVKNVLGSFQKMLAEMVTAAARKQIIFSMGFGGSVAGGAGAAMAGVGGAGGLMGGLGNLAGGVGILGKIGGAIGGFMSGIWSGVTAAFSGVNSIFAIGANALQASALTGASMLSSTIGAILGPIALVAFAVSALIGKTKLLNQGIAVTVDGFDALVQTFQTTRKSRLFGLIKSRAKTSFADAPPELADPLSASVAQIQFGVLNMAEVLGYNAKTFEDFAHRIEVSTMGMSDEEAAKAVQEAIAGMSDAFAGMIDGLDGMRLEGEGATDALTRLSAALSAVNPVMDTLGHSFRAVGLLGAGLASDLVIAFGGLDAFGQATARYYETFYSEAERMATATRQATEALAKLGGIMPRTRDEYRRMVESLDVTTEAGRDLYAALVSMSDVFDFILPKVGALSAELEAMVTGISTGVDAMIAEATAAARANEQAAATWYKAASSIRDFIDRLRGTAGALVSARDARTYNEARYQTMLAAAMGGDIGATQGLTGAAQALLDSTKATARTRVDLARAEARVLADLGLVQGVADIEGARHDVIAGLLGEQVALLEEVKAYLAGGGALDPAQIEALSGQLGALGEAIKAAEMINYAFLKERLAVSVDVLADADVPPYLRKLIKDAQTGIAANIDFITRSDLPADMKWLALTGQSELIKTVEFAVTTGEFTADLQDIALTGASTMVKTIQFLAGKLLPADLAKMTLTEASTLLKQIEFVAGALPADIKAIVLNDITALDKTINLLVGKTVNPKVATLALAEATEFSRILNVVAGKIVTADVQALALANPTAFQRTLNVLAGIVPDAEIRALALNAATPFQRIINFKVGAGLSMEDRWLAVQTASTMNKTINMLVGSKLDTDTLRIALAGNSELARTVNATLAADIDPQAKRLALGNLGSYSVAVWAALAPGVSADVRRIVLTQQGWYGATIWGAISSNLSGAAKRVLLTQQGWYTANIFGVLAANMTANTKRLLLEANTSALRSITVSAVFASTLTADQRAALSADALEVGRVIRAAIDLAGLSATGALYLAQLGLGNTTVRKSLALTATGTLTEDQRRALVAVSGSTWRALNIYGKGTLTADQRGVLNNEGGSTWRAFNVWSKGELTDDQSGVLHNKGGATWRTLNVFGNGELTDDQSGVLNNVGGKTWRNFNVWSSGELTDDQSAVLHHIGDKTWRTFNLLSNGALTDDQSRVLGHKGDATWRTFNLWSKGGLTDDQRRVITMDSGTTWRTVKAAVDMTALNDRQKSLLDAISGGSVGKITLGGSFVFDPATGFKTWYETTTKAAMTVPMDSLRASLGSLATALREETARQVAASAALTASLAAQAKIRAVETAMSGLRFDPNATYTSASGWTGTGAYMGDWTDMYRLAGALGVDLKWSGGAAKSAEQMRLAIEKAMRDAGLIGLDEMLWLKSGATNNLDADKRWFEWLKAQGVPGFASGGLHTGGLRMVGENGPELEATGPARIYSASQTRAMLSGGGDDAALVAELRALRAEVAAFKEEQRQLGLQTATNTERTRKTLGKWDAVGAPVTGVGGRPVQTEGV